MIVVVPLVDNVIASFVPVLNVLDGLLKSIVPPPVLPETLIPLLDEVDDNAPDKVTLLPVLFTISINLPAAVFVILPV